MAVVGELLTLFTGNNTQLLATAASSDAAMRGHAAQSAATSTAIRTAALGIGVAAVAGMAVGIKAAADFQDQMAIINTIAHQSPVELTKTGDAIRAMAISTGTPLSDMTKAFYDLLSAGIPASQAMAVLGQATTLAIGGLATTTQTVDLLTTAINAYGLNTKQVAVVTDQFALAVQNGKVTADQIAATFADIAPIAKTAGIGIDEITAGYAHFTAGGVGAAEFTTQMNRAIVELLKPNAALADLQERTGKNFAAIAADKGLVVAFQEMRGAAEQAHVPFQDLFGRLEGFKFALKTTGPEFIAYQSQLTQMHSATGTAAAQAEERMFTFNRQASVLGVALGDLAISIGTGFLPTVTSLVMTISGAVVAASAWADANPQLVSTILPVVAAVAGIVVAATSLGAIFGVIGTAIAVITSPLLVIGGALVVLAAHFGLLGEGAQGMVDGLLSKIPALAQGFVEWINGVIPQVVTALQGLSAQISAWIGAQVPGWLAQLQTWSRAFVDWVGPMIPPVIAALGQLVGQIAGWIGAQAPSWIAQLGAWAGAFVDWVAPMIPRALAALGDLGARVIAWIAAQLPGWAAQLLRWADAFMGWVAPMIPKILSALGQFGVQLVQWILQQIPVVALALGRLAIQFVEWVLPKIPVLLVSLGQLAIEVLAWIARQVPVIALEIGKWAVSLVGWVIGAIPTIQANLGQWLLSILQWAAGVPATLIKAFNEFGATIGKAIVAGIGDIGGQIVQRILGQSQGAADFTAKFQEKFGRGPNPAEFAQYQAGKLPGFAAGGVVPGAVGAPMLAIVHGGETITPGGRGGETTHVIHNHIHLDGREIKEWIERTMFDDANRYSSGFAPASVGG